MRSHKASLDISVSRSESPLEGHPLSASSRRSMEVIKAIQRLSEQINAQFDRPIALDAVIQGLIELLDTQRAAVYLIGNDGDLVCEASRGLPAEYVEFTARNMDHTPGRAVLSEKTPLTVVDIDGEVESESMRQVASAAGIKSYILAPLLSRGGVIGYLAAYYDEPRYYSPDETELVMAFAGLAATVITNARLYAETKQRERDATFLSDASRIFDSSLELPLVLQAVVERAKGVIGDWCSILLLDKEGRNLEPLASSSILCNKALPKLEEVLAQCPIHLNDSLTGRVVATGKSCLIPDYSTHPQDIQVFKESFNPQSYMATPISAKGRVLGVLLVVTFSSSGRVLEERNLRLASALAERAATAIENARLFEQVIDGKRVWEQTFDAITDGISIHDRHFNIIRANKAFASMCGSVPRKVIGCKCYAIIYKRDTPCESCPHEKAVVTGRCAQGASFEKQMGDRHLYTTVYPLKDGSGSIVASVHVMKDITEQKVLQEQLIRSERLRALGEMASGVAHNFNNLLAAILGRAELLFTQTTDPRLRESLKVMRQAAIDGAQTVRRIQDYTRIRKDVDASLVNLNEVVLGAIELSKPKWKDEPQRRGVRIELSTELKSTAMVAGNPSELREVLVNLIFNAVDAMPSGGSLRISTRQEEERVVVSVEDSGLGMPEEVQKRVFDPFYTTKGQSGNGLGLSIAYGIITRHRGEITVSSVQGSGSTFTVVIPRATVPNMESLHLGHGESKPARILIVDDDHEVLDTLKLLLARQGHTVVSAASGAEALQRLEKSHCDLVITDLGMPEMNGWELANAIKERNPAMPVALHTGWGVEIDPEQMRRHGIDRLIPKPCDSQTMAATISEMLSGGDEKIGHLRILIVDDEKRFGEVLAERLQLDGHEVRAVTNGALCLDLLDRWHCDTVFADYKLPDVTGTELVRAVRERLGDSFIVLMTGFATSLNDPSFIANVDAVLPKPWKQLELEDTLRRAWALKKSKEGPLDRRPATDQS